MNPAAPGLDPNAMAAMALGAMAAPPAAPPATRPDTAPTRRPLTSEQRTRRADEVQEWQQRIQTALGERAREERVEIIKRCREGIAGWLTIDGAKRKARRNLIGAQAETLLPFVYSQSPQISVRPRDPLRIPGVEGDDLEPMDWRRVLPLVIELVMARYLDQAGVTDKGKTVTSTSLTTGQGVIKLVVQDSGRENISRLENDVSQHQEHLSRVRYALAQLDQAEASPSTPQADLEDAGDAGARQPVNVGMPGSESPLSGQPQTSSREDLDRMRTELEHHIESLHAASQDARKVRTILQVVKFEDWLVSPDVTQLKDHLSAAWQAFRTVMPRKDFEAKFGQVTSDITVSGPDAAQTVSVWAIYDRQAGVIHWLPEGAADFACDSEPPFPETTRFYPTHLLPWRWASETDRYPMGAVEDWLPIVEEVEESVERERALRKATKLALIVNGQAVDPDNVVRVKTAGDFEYVVVNGNTDFPMEKVFLPFPNPPYPAELFDISRQQAHLDQISGVAEFLRGGGIRSKTATESSYMQEGLASRLSDRLNTIESFFVNLGRQLGEMLLQTLSKDDVREIAGEAGASYWPEAMSLKQLHEVMQFSVRAGATQNPSKVDDKNTLNQLLPILQGLMTNALNLAKSGNVAMAQALRNLAIIVIQRYDDRLDIEEIWPKTALDPAMNMAPGVPGMPGPGGPANMPPPPGASSVPPPPGNATADPVPTMPQPATLPRMAARIAAMATP